MVNPTYLEIYLFSKLFLVVLMLWWDMNEESADIQCSHHGAKASDGVGGARHRLTFELPQSLLSIPPLSESATEPLYCSTDVVSIYLVFQPHKAHIFAQDSRTRALRHSR
jgi:hypothetical protein